MSIDSLHVRADRIIENRRDILESAMQSAILLKNIKLVRSLNRQKNTQLTKFKKNLKEITSLISEFKLEKIPEPKVKKQIKKIVVKPEPEKIEIPKEKTQIERDLEDIQEKLRNLRF